MNRRMTLATLGFVAALLTSACAQGSETSGGSSDMLTLNGDRADFVEAYEAAGEELKDITGYGIQPRNGPS